MLALFGLILPFVVLAVVGAIILRASCGLLNFFWGKLVPDNEVQRVFAEQEKPPVGSRNVDPDDENPNPYAAPAEYSVHSSQIAHQSAVHVPRFLHAFGIVALWCISFGIVNGIINAIANQSLPTDTILVRVGLALSTLCLGFAILSGLLTAMLPTNFFKACLVSLSYTIIWIAVIFVLGFAYGAALVVFAPPI